MQTFARSNLAKFENNRNQYSIFIIIILFTMSSLSLAERVTYCPSKINCIEDKNINSCNVVQPDLMEGWSSDPYNGMYDHLNNLKVIKGIYIFESAIFYQHAIVMCSYKNQDTKITNLIRLSSTNLFNLDPMFNASSKWNFQLGVIEPDCLSENAALCPLKNSDMVIATPHRDASNYSGGLISIFIYGQFVTYNSYLESISLNSSFALKHFYCRDMNICDLTVLDTAANIEIGTITVDLNDKLRVIKIINKFDELNNSYFYIPYKLQKVAYLNAISIIKR